MNIRIKKIFTLVPIMGLILLFSSCDSYVSKNTHTEVSYKMPEIKKNTNMGAELPSIDYESQHRIIFSHSLGIFIYDLDDSKMLRAIMIPDSKLHIRAQGDATAVVQVNDIEQAITIHEVGSQPLDYYYKYDITTDKLYKLSMNGLNLKVKKTEITGRMDTNDWSAWDLIYTSQLTGKTYYPFRDIIE